MSMRSLYVCFLILALQPILSRAQAPSPAQQKDPGYELWRVRAQTITDDLLKDATELTPNRQAVLWARLARLWWRDDSSKSAIWIGNAIDVVERVPNKENVDSRRQRLETARLLLQIVGPLDQKQSKRLLTILTKDVESITDAERAENVDGLLNAAVALVAQDPKRAVDVAAMALRLGQPNDIATFLFNLRRRDVKLADDFLAQVLALAKQNPTPQLLNSLTDASYPAQRAIGANIAVPPDPLRTELLQVDLAYLNANPINAENQGAVCLSVGGFIAPLLSEFDRLVPQQAVVVRQAVSKCQSLSPLPQQRINDAASDQPLNTVDALLKAAADAKDEKVRTVYEFRAAMLAKEKKDYELALKILDDMSKESREFMATSWDAYRWDWAALAALEHYKQGRLLEMTLVLNAVPSGLQAFAKAAFVDRFVPKKNDESNPALQFLSEARTGLRKSNLPESEKYSWYFGLLRLTLKYQPEEANAAFKEAIASLNRAQQANDKEGQPNTLNTTELAKTLPASLLEMDEFAVKEGIASVTSVETRAQLRLELLNGTLERMRNAQAKPKVATIQ